MRTEIIPLLISPSGRLSRLLKRRAVNGNKGVERVDELPPNESPVYLPTEAHRSPADDWSDWTSFTLELEVHPATSTGADGNSLRYCVSLSFYRWPFFHRRCLLNSSI